MLKRHYDSTSPVDWELLAHDISESLATIICVILFYVVVGGIDSILTMVGL